MARSLEGKWFMVCYNNGVDALVSNLVYKDIMRRQEILLHSSIRELQSAIGTAVNLLPQFPVGPIFTFTHAERYAKSPWFTGTCPEDSNTSRANDFTRLQNYITRHGGHTNTARFYVPFSNGIETGMHGVPRQLHELSYATTHAQFEETFGISLRELRDPRNEY
jgi:hypothetical protein